MPRQPSHATIVFGADPIGYHHLSLSRRTEGVSKPPAGGLARRMGTAPLPREATRANAVSAQPPTRLGPAPVAQIDPR